MRHAALTTPLVAISLVAISLVAISLVGCTPASTGSAPPPLVPPAPQPVEPQPGTREAYQEALERFRGHDEKADWAPAVCAEVARDFVAISERHASTNGGKGLAEAIYNAGLSWQRCGDDGQARGLFERALSIDPADHRARAQLVMAHHRESSSASSSGQAGLDTPIAALQKIVLDAQFRNAEALVYLAALQMKRNGVGAGPGCDGDLDCARKNIQRALAVDDGYVPAYNQLAIYYLERARLSGGRRQPGVVPAARGQRRERPLDQQQLELAALVCSQAIQKSPRYAPVHNTAGLVQAELGNITGAVRELRAAIDIDPRYFDALMNYAALNLSFRGFKQAEEAYRAAFALRPGDYDVNIGLSLSLRGQIDEASWEQGVRAAQEPLDRAKRIAVSRPEAYFNEGILTQEFKARGAEGAERQIAELRRATELFRSFIGRAGEAPELSDAVRRAGERIKDIDATIGFLQQGASSGGAPGGAGGDPG
jgi:Tfp pilus assembly protein PilF